MTDFSATKALFTLPEGMIYLDGNSLGPLPRATAARVAQTVTEEWGKMLITGWNKAGWMDKPMHVGDRIARLIGAEAGHVVMGDTLSIKVYQALAACLDLNPKRRVILSDTPVGLTSASRRMFCGASHFARAANSLESDTAKTSAASPPFSDWMVSSAACKASVIKRGV